MDYKKVYDALMEKRRSNPVPNDEYGERHHIVPRSEGGTDDGDNLVRLTAREHYIAHLLLAKIYSDVKMYSAVIYMQCRTNTQNREYKFNSRLYEKMRLKFSDKQRGMKIGTRHWYSPSMNKYFQTKEKPTEDAVIRGNPSCRQHWSYEQKRHMSEMYKGIPKSEETKLNMKAAQAKMRVEMSYWYNPTTKELRRSTECPGQGWRKGGCPASEEKKNKISKALKGKKYNIVLTDELREKKRWAAFTAHLRRDFIRLLFYITIT